MSELKVFLERSAARHSRLCPRQVLGVRLGLAGATTLGIKLPTVDKGLMVIVETDGCFADGVEVSTGCAVGHRTMRIEDYGKIAATLVDTCSGKAIRLAPRGNIRERAFFYCPGEPHGYLAQLRAYQIMPDNELFLIREVRLTNSIEKLVSRAGVRIVCEECGEEIINQRETFYEGRTLCLACATAPYYAPA